MSGPDPYADDSFADGPFADDSFAPDPIGRDSFAHDDAAYVLGALGPARRQAFEDHLAGCAACTRAVRDLAGIPGLLARLDEAAFTGSGDPPSVPDTLLPQLLRGVRRRRRRTRWLGLAAAAVAGIALVTALLVIGGVRPGEGPGEGPGNREGDPPPALAMTQVDQEVLNAAVSLQQVAWGTKLRLSCSYAAGAGAGGEYGGQYGDEVPSYALIVHTGDGSRQQVATWRAVPGRTTQLEAATSADRDEIRTVDVVDERTGRSVLTLDNL